jgi:hypothetical protein
LAIQREAADLLGVDRGLRLEVEGGEFFHRREVRELQRHLDAAMVLAGDLALAQQRLRLARRQVRARRLVEQIVELVADAGELQPRQHFVEPVGRHVEGSVRARHQKPPPIAASYSVSGRSR